MQTKIIMLLTLIAYSIIVGQSFMYIIALKNAQLGMQATTYIEFRKLVDAGFMANYKWAIYAGLLLSLFLVLLNFKNPGGLLFITALIAFVALVADTLLAVKGNLPINAAINSWAVDNYPADWASYRTRWLEIFHWRQVANITGFISLLIGAVFGNR